MNEKNVILRKNIFKKLRGSTIVAPNLGHVHCPRNDIFPTRDGKKIGTSCVLERARIPKIKKPLRNPRHNKNKLRMFQIRKYAAEKNTRQRSFPVPVHRACKRAKAMWRQRRQFDTSGDVTADISVREKWEWFLFRRVFRPVMNEQTVVTHNRFGRAFYSVDNRISFIYTRSEETWAFVAKYTCFYFKLAV